MMSACTNPLRVVGVWWVGHGGFDVSSDDAMDVVGEMTSAEGGLSLHGILELGELGQDFMF